MQSFDYQGALDEGYSDEEISQFLQQENPTFDYSGAISEGYSLSEVNTFLSQGEPKEPEKASFFPGTKHMLSELTLGASENIDLLKMSKADKEALMASDHVGGFLMGMLPVEGAIKLIANPISKQAAEVALRSTYGTKVISSMGRLLGMGTAGAATKGAEKIFNGELPSAEDLFNEGATWIALDLALSAAGKLGSFTKNLVKNALGKKQSSEQVLKEITDRIVKSGVDLRDAEAVTTVAENFFKKSEASIKEAAESEVRSVTPKDAKIRPEQAAQAEKIKGVSKEVSDLKPEKPFDIKNKKITDQKIDDIHNIAAKHSQPVVPKEIDFYATVEEAAGRELGKKVDKFHPKAASEEVLGLDIQQGIRDARKAATAEENLLYDRVKSIAATAKGNSEAAVSEAKKLISKMQLFKTRPPHYDTVLKHAQDVVSDLGKGTSSVAKMIEIKQRLSKIIGEPDLIPGVKKQLNKVIDALKKDIKAGLSKVSPKAESLYSNAEALYSTNQNIFNNKNILGVRGSSTPENIPKLLNSVSRFKELKNALPKSLHPELERAYLDQLREMSAPQAQKSVENTGRYLSKKSQDLANEIAGSKHPSAFAKKELATQNILLDEFASLASENSARPETALRLWKSEGGKKVVKRALNETVNGKEISNYLTHQTTSDITKTVVNDAGKIDPKKVSEILGNKTLRDNLIEAGGPGAANFLKELSTISAGITKNAKILEKLPQDKVASLGKSMIERTAKLNKKLSTADNIFREQFPKKGKKPSTELGKAKLEKRKNRNIEEKNAIEKEIKREKTPYTTKINEVIDDQLGTLGKGVLVLAGMASWGKAASAYAVLKAIENPVIRDAIKKASKKSTSPLEFVLALQSMDQLVEES